MQFVDTHCHIHEAIALAGDESVGSKWLEAGIEDPQVLINSAVAAGVTQLICVGTSVESSEGAAALADSSSNCWASIGIHPHEAKKYINDSKKLQQFRNLTKKPRVVAIGECGLDYYYTHSPKNDQEKLFRFQLEAALEQDLPLIFHVREAFGDFWKVFDEYKGLRGVVHSFSANRKELDQILERGLYVGLNGITTFTSRQDQLEAAQSVPLDRLLLETDAPFLTPVPFRGKICEPKYLVMTAEFLAGLRGETLEELAAATSQNAAELFKLKV